MTRDRLGYVPALDGVRAIVMSRLSRIRRPGALEVALFAELPLLIIGWLVFLTYRGGSAGLDFAIFRRAGADVLHGRSPYVKPIRELLAQNTHFVYPAPFAYPFIPFTLVSAKLGAICFLLLSVAAISASLRLLGIRDWRLYGTAILAAPTFVALGVGALGPLLLVAVAAGWRLRRSPWAGVMLALAAAAKLFLWPLLIWLLVTRRLRASAAATATVATLLAFWAVASPATLATYPATARAVEHAHPSSYALGTLGFPVLALALLAVIAVAIACRVAGDEAGFAAAVAGSLLATPLLWLHYLVLLFVPLALYRPRLSWPWLVPVCLWVTPSTGPHGSVWRICAVGVAVVVVWLGSAAATVERRMSPAPPAM